MAVVLAVLLGACVVLLGGTLAQLRAAHQRVALLENTRDAHIAIINAHDVCDVTTNLASPGQLAGCGMCGAIWRAGDLEVRWTEDDGEEFAEPVQDWHLVGHRPPGTFAI